MKRWLCLFAALLLYMASPHAAALAANDCKTIHVPAKPGMMFPLATRSVDSTSQPLLASDKAYTHSSHQCFHISNPTGQPQQVDFYLQNPRVLHAEFLQAGDNGMVLLGVAGLDYPLRNWKYLGGEIVFPLTVPAHSTLAVELNIGANAVYNSQLVIAETSQLKGVLEQQQDIAGILAGLILSLVLYTAALALNSGDRTYFYLAGSTTAASLLQMSDLGILYPLWPDAVFWNQACSVLFAMLSTIAGCGMARNYLLTAEAMPRADRLLRRFSTYLFIVLLPLSFSLHNTLQIALYAIPTAGFMLFLIGISIIRIREGYQPASLYLVALLLPVIAGFAILFTYMGLLPVSPATRLAPLLATAMQLILFALALGERINWLEMEQKRSEQDALAARTETAAKKNFLAQISHELRTPLAGIIGLAELARKKDLLAEQTPLINGLEDSARQLLETTNMLLDHARLDAGKWPVRPEKFRLDRMLQELANHHRRDAELKRLSLSCHLDSEVPERLEGDQEILRRILGNFIDNAIKFTSDGGITVRAEASHVTDGQVWIRFDVLDTGQGFDELFKSRAFELFELADTSTTRYRQGPGLGLSLSKKLCQLAGGEIGCDSNPQHGTVFWCILPFTVLPAEQPGTTSAVPASRSHMPPARSGRRILVAEDDEALRMIISAQLENLHQHFTVYPHGKPLVAEYKQHYSDIACLLLDWNMPVCNASEAIHALREFEQQEGLPPVPVIIMSAYDNISARELDIAADIRILQKPVTMTSLARLLPAVVPTR